MEICDLLNSDDNTLKGYKKHCKYCNKCCKERCRKCNVMVYRKVYASQSNKTQDSRSFIGNLWSLKSIQVKRYNSWFNWNLWYHYYSIDLYNYTAGN